MNQSSLTLTKQKGSKQFDLSKANFWLIGNEGEPVLKKETSAVGCAEKDGKLRLTWMQLGVCGGKFDICLLIRSYYHQLWACC